MPIKIKNLGLTAALRGVAQSVSSSELYIIERRDENDNDFEAEDAHYELIQTLPAFGVRQMSSEEARYEFGAIEASFVRCTIATPRFEIESGQYAILNFSDGGAIYKGVIERVQPKLSSLIYVYINTAVSVEFNTLDLGVIL